jgi:ferric-dicitrate binding protein FerR (iron transport regulator)
VSHEQECAEALAARLLDDGDAGRTARVERHRRGCSQCLSREAGLRVVSEAVLGVSTAMDDIQRARIGAALEQQIRQPRRRRSVPLWILVPAAAAAAAALVVLARRLPDRHPTPVVTVSAPRPSLIRPYRADGPASSRRDVGGSFDRLEIPAGTRMRARLGDHARVTLVGPAEVQVTGVSDQRLVLALSVGTLVADYEQHTGRTLVIESPGLVTEVVGTQFAVEARGDRTRVSVAHGRVWVRPAGGTATLVGDGKSWATDQPVVRPMAATTVRLFEDHAAETDPSASRSGNLGAVDASAARLAREAPPRQPARRRVASIDLAPPPAVTGSPESPPLAPAANAPAATAPPAHAPTSPHAATRTSSHAATRTSPAAAASSPARPALPVASAPASAPMAPEPLPATPSPAAMAPAPAAAPPLRAADLYHQAEAAMARRDPATAERRLAEVVTRFPTDPLADTARYDLIEHSLAAGDRSAATRRVKDLLTRGREPALLEAAAFLQCRMAFEDHEAGEAGDCLASFRAAHPTSARDGEALVMLVHLAGQAGACQEVRRLAAEHRRRYPATPLPAVVLRIETSCPAR